MAQEINRIIQMIVECDNKYVLDQQYIRWGLIEKDINAIVDEARRERDEAWAQLAAVTKDRDEWEQTCLTEASNVHGAGVEIDELKAQLAAANQHAKYGNQNASYWHKKYDELYGKFQIIWDAIDN